MMVALLGCRAFEANPSTAPAESPAQPIASMQLDQAAPEPTTSSAFAPATSPALAPPDPTDARWAPARGPSHARVRETGQLVLHVFVPLCHNDQVVCGSKLAGDPDNLDHNLYWGAIFGQKRFFSRKASEWKVETLDEAPSGTLARAVFSRSFAGNAWDREAPITAWVVFDAIHGDDIDGAIDTFYAEAERGALVSWVSVGQQRRFPVDVVGYAGHNRMMDGKKPPEPTTGGQPIPSFVMACYSKSWFEDPLAKRGSKLLASTRALMAPEGYVLDALATSLAQNETADQTRRRVAAAYGRWQNLSDGAALNMF